MSASPFLSKRNARRVALTQTKKHADTINPMLCEGRRTISIHVGLVDAVAQLFNEAGGWSAIIKSRDESAGVVLLKPDPTAVRKGDDNPFYSYSEVRRRSVEYVGKAAVTVNEGLEQGRRVFQFPIGLAQDIVDGLNAAIDDEPSGWLATLGQTSDEAAVLIVAESSEDEPTPPPEASEAAAS